MSMIRWSPSVWDPFEEMEEMLGRPPVAGGRSSLPSMGRGFVPAMDVYETKDAVTIETPLAGVDPKDVQVTVEKGVLTVQGFTKKEHEVDEKNYYRKEVRSGSFYRQVALPAAVKEDGVVAEFADGLLKITCPKAAPAHSKKVTVQVKGKKK